MKFAMFAAAVETLPAATAPGSAPSDLVTTGLVRGLDTESCGDLRVAHEGDLYADLLAKADRALDAAMVCC
jgi:hypothetical protein